MKAFGIAGICIGLVGTASALAQASPDPAPSSSASTTPAPSSSASTTPAVPPAAQCALHIWPGSPMRSTYHGWFHGGIVDGAVQGRDGYRKLPEQPLATARQIEILKASDLGRIFARPDYQVVIHETALTSQVLRRTAGRLHPGGPECYAEFAVDDVFFQEDVINGRFLKILGRFREFGSAEAPLRTFGTLIQVKLQIFPPKTPEDDLAGGLAELGTAYAKAVEQFGMALNKPKKK